MEEVNDEGLVQIPVESDEIPESDTHISEIFTSESDLLIPVSTTQSNEQEASDLVDP